MVDLLLADPSLGVEGAATAAASRLPGKSSTHIERLRKKYRRLAKAGTLPKGGREGWLDRRSTAIREYFNSRKTDIDTAKSNLVETEREAEALGIDTSRQDLFGYIRELERRREALEIPAQGNMLFAASWFVEQNITDPEEAVARFRQAAEEFELIEKQLVVLRKLRMQRGVAGLPS